MWFYIYKCIIYTKCHIYKCGNIQISDTNGTLYQHDTIGPTEREARGGLGHAARARHTFGACALHVILFEGASRSTAALHNL